MRATVLTPLLEVTPGEAVDVQLEVVNTLDIVDLVTLEVIGLDPSEVRFDRESVSLFPEESAVVTMTLRLRRAYPAGRSRITVRVASALRPQIVELRHVDVDVAPSAGAELEISPKAVVAKSSTAEVTATVRNTGNVPLNVAMRAADDQRHLRFVIDHPSLGVGPESEAVVNIKGKGRRPFFGAPTYRLINVNADSEAGLLEDTVSLTQRPVIARGIFTALVLAAIVALWAAIVTFGVDLVLGSDPAPKAAPADFASPVSLGTLASVGSAGAVGGAGASAVEAILGSVSGTVVAAGNGQPIPRISVEAHRQRRDAPSAPMGSSQTRVQSAATDENGVFTLDGIFPGRYMLKLVGPGFEESWYPGVPAPAGAEPVVLDAGEDLELEPVSASGLPGSITGTIDAGDRLSPITVVIRPVVDDVPGPEAGRAEVNPVDGDGDGMADQPARYEFGGLATPFSYRISVTSEDFADQAITEELGAGEALEAAPIRLLAGEGELAGTVILTGRPPDKGVTVTATSGASTFTVETPAPAPSTDGSRSTVEFRLSGLPSPATYGLVFTAPGYEPAQRSVDVLAGEVVDAGAVTMSGGSRTLAGLVVDPHSGLRLGDVDVTVLLADSEVTTKTLPAPTTPGPGATANDCRTPPPVAAYDPSSGAGTFVIDNLPLGILSVTFSAPGRTSATHRIEVTGERSPRVLTPGFDDGVVELADTVGEVCGTVRGPGGVGIATGSVLLRGGPRASGGTDRSPTPLASSPAGAFKITDLEQGEYTLTASADGFRSCSIAFRVRSGARGRRQRMLDIELVPTSAPPTAACRLSEVP